MSEDGIRLSPTSYVVLGLIHLRGPSTPYELESAVRKSVEYFWTFPHSQLYREPDRLTASGHLTVDQEPGGRRRKVFALTPRGRSALDTWLTRPVEDVFEMRDEAVLQLFFSDQLTATALVDLARHEIALYQRRLDEYERIAARELPRHGQDRRMAPLRLGIKLAEAFREFWEEIAADPPPPTPVPDPVDGPPGRLC
ncbi:PadR family transcriptional regulator [Pseudonocardia abyssalis]|uniref:PadR family transcriptional regulator n=1 Tax=Pseudonocardia abyssalis TaxID=2792008 RepID=A0ABS6V3B1_9PSEU|nr:PadR family transcriptional regulator [Pseudonocardia abyssalis]MBW0118788.1 PadR family transcriptional regulator [Pseudonocardia abyssalis]MBW0138509.1 PadR family transcriptional regulator [Pseudonocardia abyssalis]